jgi:hypothetical protein
MADLNADYRTGEVDASTLMRSGRPSGLPSTSSANDLGMNGTTDGLIYRMRGYSASLGRYVYWSADLIDSNYSEYTGPGTPLTNIAVFAIQGST